MFRQWIVLRDANGSFNYSHGALSKYSRRMKGKHFFPSNFPLASRTWCCLFISFTYQFHFMLAINRITMLQWKILSVLPFSAPQTLSRPLACLLHRNLCKLIKLKCWWWKFLPFSQCFSLFTHFVNEPKHCVCSLDFGKFSSSFLLSIRTSFFRGRRLEKDRRGNFVFLKGHGLWKKDWFGCFLWFLIRCLLLVHWRICAP